MMEPFGLTFKEMGWVFAGACFLLFAIAIIRLTGGRNDRVKGPAPQKPQLRENDEITDDGQLSLPWTKKQHAIYGRCMNRHRRGISNWELS